MGFLSISSAAFPTEDSVLAHSGIASVFPGFPSLEA